MLNIQNMKKQELTEIIAENANEVSKELLQKANEYRNKYYGKRVFVRGLIEFSNYCRNDCYYCGIRHGNHAAIRYRMGKEEILAACSFGYGLGFRTFVLQGGEDPFYTDSMIISIIESIRSKYPETAITLSMGEKDKSSYKAFFDAGADRYLLRHETAAESLYAKLHPAKLSLSNRKKCLYDLREIGFQVGAGFLVQAPYQELQDLAEDLLFLKDLQPHMVGIGPFIPHKDTPFSEEKSGTINLTITMLALTRLMLPDVLLPATTALATIDTNGREKGLNAGANVIMPNLSPEEVRNKYLLYNGKAGIEAAALANIKDELREIGFEADMGRGDHKDWISKGNCNGR